MANKMKSIRIVSVLVFALVISLALVLYGTLSQLQDSKTATGTVTFNLADYDFQVVPVESTGTLTYPGQKGTTNTTQLINTYKTGDNGTTAGMGPVYIKMVISSVTFTSNETENTALNDEWKTLSFENVSGGVAVKNNEISFFGGDFNICPVLEKDVYSVKKDGVITCTQKERDKFKNFLNIGMHDTFRELNEDLIEFSWWGYRPYFMFEKNQGFRLDAILTTDYSFKFVQDCYIEKKVRGMERPSDHAPMSCLLIL